MSRIQKLSQCLVEKYGLNAQESEDFVTSLFALIREKLLTERIVKVKGLGTFKLAEMNARESINVNTGERITIEGRYKLSFTPENAVKDRINSPFASFESVDMDDDVDFTQIDERYTVSESEPESEHEPQSAPKPEPELELLSEPKLVTEQVPVPEPKQEPEPEPEPVTVPVPEPVQNPESEYEEEDDEDNGEEEPEEKKNSHLLIWLLIVSFVLIDCFGGYFLYNLGRYNGINEYRRKNNITSEVKEDTTVVVKHKTVVKKHVVKPAANPEAEPLKTSNAKAEIYNKDARVRTGAYEIVGTDVAVTVRAGQTLKSISKSYLGDGMECYVEVYNGGKTSFKEGEKINIPKLKLKKRRK